MGMLTYYRMELSRFLDQNDARLVAEGSKLSRFGNANLRPAQGKGKSAHKTKPLAEAPKTQETTSTPKVVKPIAKEWT